MFKAACADSIHDRETCRKIMDEIYREDPSYWPNGLSLQHHDGGCWLVRKASTREPVGFVGFQIRPKWDGTKNAYIKVGYYTIGILPKYRGSGLAGGAVRQVVEKMAGRVDRVEALIMEHNRPSIALAEKLKIPMILKSRT